MRRAHVRPPRSFTVMNWIQTAAIITLVTVLIIAMWPSVLAGLASTPPPVSLPTAAVQLRLTVGVVAPPVVATPLPAEIATPAPAVGPQNIGPEVDLTPVTLEVRPAPERWLPPAGTVPTEDASKGEREMGGFNPQLTHECRHGQQWIDGAGCKNVLR